MLGGGETYSIPLSSKQIHLIHLIIYIYCTVFISYLYINVNTYYTCITHLLFLSLRNRPRCLGGRHQQVGRDAVGPKATGLGFADGNYWNMMGEHENKPSCYQYQLINIDELMELEH